MIDIENKVVNEIKTTLVAQYPEIKVYAEFIPEKATYPCVSVNEITNMVAEQYRDCSAIENYAIIGYEINAFSEGTNNKAQCKNIVENIDNTMLGLGFTRTSKTPIPNSDRSIYRIVIRYSGLVSKGITKGSNTKYTIYKN